MGMEKCSRFCSPLTVKLALLLFVLPFFLCGQSNSSTRVKSFSALSAPEKRWVIAHPFIAKKTFALTQRARFVTDSLSKNGILKDGNGGQLDAFRHAYWMALLAQEISTRKAVKLGKAHEKGNYLGWKKGLAEDSMRADSILCVMDLLNNEKGIAIGKTYLNDTARSGSLEEIVLKNVLTGKLLIVKKNAKGQAEDAAGRIIVMEDYKRKWYVPKVLVRSDYKEPMPDKN
jgi:hypothetical protein